MNEELKLRHLATITHESAVEMYEKLCAACEQREGGMTDPDQMLVADIARAEQIKQQLLDDIAKRGIGQERSNGRQKYWQENRSVAQVRAYRRTAAQTPIRTTADPEQQEGGVRFDGR